MADKHKPKRKTAGPIRENVDAFAIAILIAVLMKYFAIEAYEIPTSSMQPTMMGSKEAGVYDRILVDKSVYTFRDPERWDVAVFRYPIRRVQNYVKRIAGLPGDRLTIAGGNVYRVDGNDPRDPQALTPLRRPPRVQAEHWREVFPARVESLRLSAKAWSLNGSWEPIGERHDAYTIDLQNGRRASLSFLDDGRGGLTNLVSDGYPGWVAREIAAEDHAAGTERRQAVQDVRLSFTIDGDLQEWSTRLRVRVPDGDPTDFTLQVDGDAGRLEVERGGVREQSDTFAVPSGPLAVRFTHVDDRLLAEFDGERVAELDTGNFKIVERLVAPRDGASAATLRIDVHGRDELRVEDLIIDRDQHYLPDRSAPIVEVPAGHYWMLGDNTQQSVDSRGWTAFVIGVDAQGRIVDPRAHPDAERMRGNLRPTSLDQPPDPDENPVPVPSRGRMAVTDVIGETHSLIGSPAPGEAWGGGAMPLAEPDGEGSWNPEYEAVPFVPREHILGRPLVTFWPLIEWFRAGPIR